MDLVPYLSAVILVSTIATILLAVLSYAAFKLRDKRRPKGPVEAPVFFHRYRLEAEGEDEAEGDASEAT
ncbi:MAG: hypothetical protein ACQGVK_00785 [Myxococcota bacterium]